MASTGEDRGLAPVGSNRSLASSGSGRDLLPGSPGSVTGSDSGRSEGLDLPLVSTGGDRALAATGTGRPLASTFGGVEVDPGPGGRNEGRVVGAGLLVGDAGRDQGVGQEREGSQEGLPETARMGRAGLEPNLEPLYVRASTAQRRGRHLEAEQLLYVLRSASPRFLDGRVRYVLSLVPLGRYHQCVQELESLLGEGPLSLDLFPALEQVYGGKAGVRRDTLLLRTFLMDRPQDPDAAVVAALLEAASGSEERAVVRLESVTSASRVAAVLQAGIRKSSAARKTADAARVQGELSEIH